MAITYRPSIGDVLLCEFGPDPRDSLTFPLHVPPVSVQPEMHKRRHVVVLGSNGAFDLIMVAPFSTLVPKPVKGYHHFVAAGTYRFMGQDSWLKGDMMMAVSKVRLDRLSVDGRPAPTALNPADRKACQAAALNALALGRLVPHL
jgi:uncharacterized protein YifN (PemK superfamily)